MRKIHELGAVLLALLLVAGGLALALSGLHVPEWLYLAIGAAALHFFHMGRNRRNGGGGHNG